MSTINLTLETSPAVNIDVDIPSPPGPQGPQGEPGIDPRIGDLDNLTTEHKDTVVDAINELNAEDVSLVLWYENQKAG